MAASAASVHAIEWRLGEEAQAKLNGAVTFGAGIRTEDPRPENYGSLAGSRVGRTGGLTSANSGGPNLNFEQGSTYSRVLKGFLDFDIHEKRVGVFARAKAWHDFELDRGDRPYGNFPNAFAQGVPLSDDGFAREAAFNGAHFTAAYVYGKFDLQADKRVEGGLGRQFVNWGTAQSITGGINVINPRDFAAAQRPGALPQETRIPVGMVYANFAAGKAWGLDGFIPYESRHDVLAGCGTYFNVATYAPVGWGAFLDEILRLGGDVNETAGDGLMVIFQNPDPRRHAATPPPRYKLRSPSCARPGKPTPRSRASTSPSPCISE